MSAKLNGSGVTCVSNNSIKHWSFDYPELKGQTFLFLTIRLSMIHLFSLSLNVRIHSLNVKAEFYPYIGSYQVLQLRDRVDLGTIAIKEYSAFHKAPELLELHNQIVLCRLQDTRLVLTLWRDVFGVFYSPSQMVLVEVGYLIVFWVYLSSIMDLLQ